VEHVNRLVSMNGLGGNAPLAAVSPSGALPRLVVATNGADDSSGAVQLAALLAERRGAAVLAVAVVEPTAHAPVHHARRESPFDGETRCDVPDVVSRALSSVPASARWTKRATRGWPADVINEAAATWDASLILLGLGRHYAIDRLFGTENAINVIKHASLPVLAVPAHMRELPRRACAAIDFTPASIAAAFLAASLLADDGTLTLLHASPYKCDEIETDPIAQLYRTTAGNRLAEVLAIVRKSTPHRVDGLLVDGEPSQAIVEFVHSEHCDLVALGGLAQTLVDRILIGSVRTRVLRSVDCAVLVAPPPSERD
jgi:nucleotide-binding universal stress UspA family protein